MIKTENDLYEDIIIRVNESKKYNLVNSVNKAWYVSTLLVYSLIEL